MLRSVDLLLANPAWRQVSSGRLTVLTTAVAPAAASDCPDHFENGITVVLRRGAAGAVEVIELFRSISTSDQLYYTVCADTLVISDCFGAVADRLPIHERRVPDTAVIDHFLFRTCPGEATYLEGISRLGAGSLLEWDVAKRQPNVRQVARLLSGVRFDSTAAALNTVDAALSRVLSGVQPDAVNLLSGGVDSTLVQSYLPGGKSVSATIDSPEFALEERYACAAASLLGTAHDLVRVIEREYPALLIDVIGRTGLPPHHLQTVLVDAAVGGGAREYISAQFADALFGLDVSYRVCRILRFRLHRLPPQLHASVALAGSPGRRFAARIKADLQQLSRSVDDPSGMAMLFAVYSDVGKLSDWFGRDIVEQRLYQRLSYVLERVEGFNPSDHPFIQHLELGHWIDFFCDDTVSIWRQCALSRGAVLRAPFEDRTVVETARAIRASVRFCAEGTTKPALKALLRGRVPKYPVTQPKGGSGLPLERYLATGPLKELAAEAAAAGGPLPPSRGKQGTPMWLKWNAITWHLWETRMRQASRGSQGKVPVLTFAAAGG